MNTHYSGYTNQQTYNTQITYDEMFQEMTREWLVAQPEESLADRFETMVMDLETCGIPRTGMALDVVEMYLSDVNWVELAADYVDRSLAVA